MKTILEIQTPFLQDIDKFADNLLRLNNFSTVILEENGGINSIIAAEMLRNCCDKEIFLKISCRDRNRIALHSELLTAAARELTNVVLVEGIHPMQTQFPAAKPVYELDSLILLKMLKHNSPDFGDGIDPPLSSLEWTIGVCIGGSTSADVARARKLVAAEADLLFVRSNDAVRRLRDVTDKPIILSFLAEETKNISAIVREAESIGADGVNMVVGNLDRVPHGSIASR